MKIRKDRMSQAEYDKYLEIGEVNLRQHWLELFTPTLVTDLFAIMDSSSDNQAKCDIIQEELKEYGFYPVGLGTNVYATANPAYPGVVFKIALDRMGLADNFNDGILCDMVNKYLGKDKFTKVLARHPSGIVSVQERKVLVANQDRMDAFRGDIIKTLNKLSKAFLIIDLSPSEYHYNYGIERNGDWCFIDASDLYPLAKLEKPITCKATRSSEDRPGETEYCGGNLIYNADYSLVICEECGRTYIPADVRPDLEKGDWNRMAEFTSDGMSLVDIEDMRIHEMEVLLAKRQKRNSSVNAGLTPIVTVEQEDDEEEDWEDFAVDNGRNRQPQPKAPVPELSRLPVPRPVQEKVEKQSIPENVPVQVHENKRKSAFIAPKPITTLPPSVTKVTPEPEPEEVEISKVVEPKVEVVQNLSTSFGPQKIVAADDEDDDDDDGGIEIIGDPLPKQLEETLNRTPFNNYKSSLSYSIVHEGDVEGIIVELDGDFDEAWAEYGLPLYFSMKGSSTLYEAVPAATMYPRICEAVYEAERELGILSPDKEKKYQRLIDKRKEMDSIIQDMIAITREQMFEFPK